jgi:hypothetical protein
MSVTPTWAEAIQQMISRALLKLHTTVPGVVQAYDAATQMADVLPLPRWQASLPGQVRSLVELPVLPDVLVCHLRAGDKGVHVPLAEGDLVLLVMCGRALTIWRQQSNPARTYDPGYLEPMPLAGAICIPMMHHDTREWSGDITSGDTINIGASGATMDAPALAGDVTAALNTLKDAISNATPVAQDGGAAFKAGILSALTTWPPDVAAEDVKIS